MVATFPKLFQHLIRKCTLYDNQAVFDRKVINTNKDNVVILHSTVSCKVADQRRFTPMLLNLFQGIDSSTAELLKPAMVFRY